MMKNNKEELEDINKTEQVEELQKSNLEDIKTPYEEEIKHKFPKKTEE